MGRISPSNQNMAGKTVNMNGGNATIDVVFEQPTPDQNRPIGSESILNDKPVYWSGENYGWQSESSHNQLNQQGKFRVGTQAIDRFTSSASQAISDVTPQFVKGAVNTYVQRLAESQQQQDETEQAIIDQGGIGAAYFSAQRDADGRREQDVEAVSKRLNIDSRLVSTALTAAETALEGKVGLDELTVFTRNYVKQMPSETVYALTLKDADNIPSGITQGSAWSPDWSNQMQDFYQRRAAIKEKLQYAESNQSKSRYDAYREESYNTVSTGPSRDPASNPEAYGKTEFKEQSTITPLTAKGNTKWQQQHHLFSKQESYQFVERMIELGDDDDVLSLFLMAEDMDSTLGGRLLNMLNMEDLPHSVLHGSRIRDGRQLQSAGMRNLVENAKSPDELMRIFREYITDNVSPSKEEAKALKIIGERLEKANKHQHLTKIRDKMYR